MTDFYNTRILLEPNEIPKEWVNIVPDLPAPMTPLINPMDGKPAPPELAFAIFPKECVLQEVSQEPTIQIPKGLRELYVRSYRPTPLHRAYGLEKELGIENEDIKIFYKNESVSPTGSHKPNTVLAQAYYSKRDGVDELITETGAGQWGSALSYGCNLFDIKCSVYMVRTSFIQKPGRKILMRAFNAQVHASPSKLTDSGRFYYQFCLPPDKRAQLSFLSCLITDTSHPWLKSAVQTLIDNEESVFRFQRVPELFPKIKPSNSIKVVNESCNKLVNKLYQTQCGMRTTKNIRMRISNLLKCPIIISPNLLEKIK